jgi:hypothetical protein
MKGEPGMSGNLDIDDGWRKSTLSSQGADCVEVRIQDTACEH